MCTRTRMHLHAHIPRTRTHTRERARTHTNITHIQNSSRVMVIAAFQRIRGLIGYRFGDVMRLIIEPAAGARERPRRTLCILVFLVVTGATLLRSVRPFPRWRSARDILSSSVGPCCCCTSFRLFAVFFYYYVFLHTKRFLNFRFFFFLYRFAFSYARYQLLVEYPRSGRLFINQCYEGTVNNKYYH